MLLKELLELATSKLKVSGSNSARLDAELLALFCLKLTRVQLVTQDSKIIDSAQIESYLKLISRRESGEPVAYITGIREFYGRDFYVAEGVLIPRPETELLVETVLDILPSITHPAKVVELGVGSGCVSLTLLSESPGLEIIATDLSKQALNIARSNAKRLGVDRRIQFVNASWLSALKSDFDLIVSNPPYVERGSVVSRECGFEPELALYADDEGSASLREIIKDSFSLLKLSGSLVLEIGHGQSADCLRQARKVGYESGRMYKDLAGKERVLHLVR